MVFDRIRNLSIRTLLTLPVGLLALLLFTVTAWETANIYVPRSGHAERLSIADAAADKLLAVAASAAQERGFTASYLTKLKNGNNDPALLRSIKEKRERGDRAFAEAMRQFDRLGEASGQQPQAERAAAQKAHEAVVNLRSAVDGATSGSVPDPKRWFRTATDYIFAASDLRLAAFRPVDQSGITEYSNNMIKQALWLAAEYAGRERAAVGQLIAQRLPMSGETRTRLSEYRALVEQKLDFVEAIGKPVLTQKPASPALQRELNAAWQEVEANFLGSFQGFREEIYDAAASGNYPVDAKGWLHRSTEAIDTIFALSDVVGRDAILRTERVRFESERSLWSAAALTIASVLLAAVALGVIFSVTRRLYHLKDTFVRIENENDLSLRADESGRNELSQVGQAFNSMLGRFGDIVTGVIQATSAVSGRVALVASASEQTEKGVQEQKAAIDQVATAMNEMAATVKEVARNTVHAAESAEGANEKARRRHRRRFQEHGRHP